MKWFALAGLAVLIAAAVPASAQNIIVPEIGNIPKVDDASPTTWAYSGYEILRIRDKDGDFTPIMRTETYDARTVEILSRVQVPPLRGSDVKVIGNAIVVRRFLLMRVLPQDARSEGTSIGALARKWAASAAHVLPLIAPGPSRVGA